MSKEVEHFAEDRCVCLGQTDCKLIFLMWVREGRGILFWSKDFHDLRDEPNTTDIFEQIRLREMMLYSQALLGLSCGPVVGTQ